MENKLLGLDDNFYGEGCFCVRDDKECKVYKMENETGQGMMTSYTVFDGVYIIYNDFHMRDVSLKVKSQPSIVEINHCREGRIECEYAGEYLYIEEGDFVIAAKETKSNFEWFPLGHYHGVSIILDFDKISRGMEDLLKIFSIDIDVLKLKLCGGSKHFIMKNNESINHIFSELYNVHDAVKLDYFKVKVVELLLFLLPIDFVTHQEKRPYFKKSQVDIVKKMTYDITTNLEEHYTIKELSLKYGMSLTTMKNCFKAIYGYPIYEYLREVRIQKSCILLRNTPYSIIEIANLVGYENPSKFAAAFKCIMGMTPSKYRKTAV